MGVSEERAAYPGDAAEREPFNPSCFLEHFPGRGGTARDPGPPWCLPCLDSAANSQALLSGEQVSGVWQKPLEEAGWLSCLQTTLSGAAISPW